jgi:arsenate reductase
MSGPRRVLFVCTGNSARSLMAEAFLRAIGGESFDVSSAGTNPKGINPMTVRVLHEVGIDDPRLRSRSVGEYLAEEFDDVITVCDQAREVCPVFPGGARRLHWSCDDPAAARGTDEERVGEFRRVRDEIEVRIRAYVAEPVAVGNA